MKIKILSTAMLSLSLVSACNAETEQANVVAAPTEAVQQTEASVQQATIAHFTTSLGEFKVALNPQAAPITVKNFTDYIESGFYDGLIFHRVIGGFMVQGGGFNEQMQRQQTQPAIVIESDNGLKNNRGTIAMARTNVPDSATSQFFINLVDNDFLNYRSDANPGYAVFGEVIEGMEVIDAIAKVQTTSKGGMRDVPADVIEIKRVSLVNE